MEDVQTHVEGRAVQELKGKHRSHLTRAETPFPNPLPEDVPPSLRPKEKDFM